MSEFVIINGDHIRIPQELRGKGGRREAIAKWYEEKARASAKLFGKKAPAPAQEE